MNATMDTNCKLRTSQLSKQLPEILKDTTSTSLLEYFLQFMESVGALYLVQFWFSVESFRSAAQCSTTEQSETLRTSEVESSSLQCDSQALSVHNTSTGKSTTQYSNSTRHDLGTTGLHTFDKAESAARAGVAGLRNHLKSPPLVERRMSQLMPLNEVTDALGIYTTYIALNATSPVGIPDEIRQRVEVNICPEDGEVDRSCFWESQSFIFEMLEKRYYTEFLQSPFLCKYQLEHISSGNLKLLDFLLADNALFYFMEYMEQESASSLLQFWLTAETFHTHMANPSRTPNLEADTSDAITIYERYFSLQALEPLNMGDPIRIDVEIKICSEDGPRVDSFVIPQQKVYEIMNKTYYPNFLESSIYLQFLNELLHMLRKGSSVSRRPSIVASESDTTIEEETEIVGYDLDDPDSLWQRPAFQMRLGTVDKFGQYRSEIEPIPSKTGLFIGSRISWLRNRKDDEELAMKIARNIVLEVLGMYSSSLSKCGTLA